MTAPGNGFGESVRKFSDDVDTAVGRARRATAEAGARAASFRAETSELAERLRSGAARAGDTEATSDELRRAAAGFRDGRGLPTEEFPEPAEDPAAEAGPRPAEPSGRRDGDEDDDFSQERIMMRR